MVATSSVEFLDVIVDRLSLADVIMILEVY